MLPPVHPSTARKSAIAQSRRLSGNHFIAVVQVNLGIFLAIRHRWRFSLQHLATYIGFTYFFFAILLPGMVSEVLNGSTLIHHCIIETPNISGKNRDQSLQLIRPRFNLPETHSNEVEHFYHQVLRPILKLQHDLLVTQFMAWLLEHKQSIEEMNQENRRNTITQACKTHKRLRAQAFGIISGLMTRQEYAFYLANQRELHKRITAMWIERILDGLDESRKI